MSKRILVVIDVQNDFVEGGALPYLYPTASNLQKVCAYVQSCAERGDYIIATRDTHHDNYLSTLEGQLLPVPHCIHETDGWNLVADIQHLADSGRIKVFDKPTFGTTLVAEHVRQLLMESHEEIDEIQFVGYDLSICIVANAVILRSRFPNMKIKVLKDLCGDIGEASFNAAVTVLRNQQIEVA